MATDSAGLSEVGVLCGDRWHPASVTIDGMEMLARADIRWDFVDDTAEWPTENLNRYAAIVLAKMNSRSATEPTQWLTEEVQRAFKDYVEQGGSLFVLHAGTVGYSGEPVFRELVGGVFVQHPSPCAVEVEPVGESPAAGTDPQPFTVHDEHYFMELFHDDLAVFRTSRSEHGVQPAAWTRRQGNGKVCVFTPGHYAEVWQNPDYRRAVASALDWCLEV